MRLAELELDALELGWVQAVRVSEATCQDIKAAGLQHLVELSVHAPYYINLNAADEEWPKSRRRLMDAAHYGHLAGATDIIFHPGSYFGAEPAAVLPVAIRRLQGCVEELRAAGNPVILRPETMGKSAMLGSLEDVLALSQAIEGVQPCLDFAHLYARPGDGSLNSYEAWMPMLDQLGETLGEQALRSMHIHLSGIAYGPKGEKEHLCLKDCDLDLDGLFRALHAQGGGGRILCESPAMEDDALEMRRVWQTLTADESD
jgi:deoxyribonuclease-4